MDDGKGRDMKQQLSFLNRLLAYSSGGGDSRPAIYRSACVLPDGRWVATDGACLIAVPPPAGLAHLNPGDRISLPLEVLIDGCRMGKVPTVEPIGPSGCALAFDDERIEIGSGPPFPEMAKVMKIETGIHTFDAAGLIAEVAQALAECEKAHPMKIADRHNFRIQSRESKKPRNAPLRSVTIDKSATVKIYTSGWRISVQVHGLAYESSAINLEPVEIGKGIGHLELMISLRQLQRAVGRSRQAFARYGSATDLVEIMAGSEFHIIAPHRF